MINVEREVGVMGRKGRWMEEDRKEREVTMLTIELGGISRGG